MSKKVLIITYYWPPSGGSAVIRWLKFAKFLPQFDWQPVIYTPLNPEAPFEDPELEKDVPFEAEIIKTKIWEPYNWYKIFTGKKKKDKIQVGFLSEKKKPGFLSKLGIYIRGNYFIPDARVFWVEPSVKKLTKYLKDNPVDAIVTTGPPHSLHLIALKLKQKLNIPWLADFRDPWTNIDFYKDLMLTHSSDKKHRKLEKEVVGKADAIVSIARNMTEEFRAVGGKNLYTITNGFDPDDKPDNQFKKENGFVILHTGTIAKSRNPEVFWKSVSELITENKELASVIKIKLIGKLDASVYEFIEKYQLNAYCEIIDFLPHDEIMKEQSKAAVLLLLINDTPNAKGILTGKFFEYMCSERPVLAIGPADGEVAEILTETGAGKLCTYDDINGIKSVISTYYDQFSNDKLIVDSSGIDKYSRKSLTKDIVDVLEKILKSNAEVR